MLISILIPVYNVAKYLPHCLESIVKQKFKDYEIILVDDGSTDESGEICDEFQVIHSSNTRVIHQKNQGLLGARIAAIREAKGKYCLCLDSDDYWEEECLEKLEKLVVRTKAEVIIFECKVYVEETGFTKTKPPNFGSNRKFVNDKEILYKELICGYSLNSIWRKLILTRLMKEGINEYDKLPLHLAAEDLVQSLYPITYANIVYYSSEQLYVYRISPKSLVSSVNAENIMERTTLIARHFLRKYMDIWKLNNEGWLEQYHCANMISLADTIFDLLQRSNNPLKTAQKLNNLDLSKMIDFDAYKYRYSDLMNFKSCIKVNLVLNRATTIIGLIAQFLKVLK